MEALVANWLRKLSRVLLTIVCVLMALLLSGMLYQSWCVRREAARFPPPGRLVDIGGRRLHLLCIGQGEPTVIFEPGALQTSVSSELTRVEVGSQTRVCSYDRRVTAGAILHRQVPFLPDSLLTTCAFSWSGPAYLHPTFLSPPLSAA